MIKAPFTPEQVEALNAYQNDRWMHPFNCGRCRDELGTMFVRESDGTLRPFDYQNDSAEDMDINTLVWEERSLVATAAGWVCWTCDYTQDWAHDFMADPAVAAAMRKSLGASRFQ